ncbi:peptidoglycan/LPS O-acetylase OafA/YrhL [Leucobacter komagatae]|uniref:Peptidoglycan/LPS O-acetylase OafA/YrhL n=1 Tax=Leucobacter komagatae TaxID=55969 RepID=A0A542Y9T4_9MICO|nr:acyltransferase family protein [Leucobacter komagatae]TQL44842.1 peptidoglycan/LPS O-acetylase OafA/YrhL [Leucobacter komagatae]
MARKSAARKHFRGDIQGLRAVAVIAVLLNHFTEWPTGGFVGVDVFFVISGFLITGMLIREYDRSATVSFRGFYMARVRRILPAAMLVIVTTVGFAALLFNQGRFRSTVVDAVWTSLFAANWNFAATGADYFQAGLPVSPLRHFWSLSVEEQFYFVWPWLILLALTFITRRGGDALTESQRRLRLGLTIGVVVAASFAWAMFETPTAPTWAYYSTLSRAWELGIGALLAIFATNALAIPALARKLMLHTGLLGILASVVLITPALPFPGPWALAPTVATALVILAGTGSDARSSAILTNPVALYIGKISYSLYLWHFPVIIFAQTLPGEGPKKLIWTVGLTAVLSIGSFHLWEDPMRKFRLRPRGSAKRDPWVSRKVVVASSLTALVVANAFLWTANDSRAAADADRIAAQTIASPVESGDEAPPADGPVTEIDTLRAELTEALGATNWDAVSPSVDDTLASAEANFTATEIAECVATSPFDPEKCTWGNPEGTKTAILAGNSHSVGMAVPLRSIFEERSDWRFVVASKTGCPFVTEEDLPQGETLDADCKPRAAEVVDAANSLDADLVIVVGAGPGADKQLAQITTGAKFAIMTPPPVDKDIQECYTPLTGPEGCVSKPHEFFGDLERQVAKDSGAAFFSATDWFCVRGMCPPLSESLLTKGDRVHVTGQFAKRLKPVIEEAFITEELIEP